MQYYVDRWVASRGWRRDRFAVLVGASLTIEGWAFQEEQGPPVAAWAVLDGERRGEGRCGLERADVAAVFGAAVPANVGFRVELRTAGVAPGQHALQLAFAFAGDRVELTEPYALEIHADVELPAQTERPRILLAAAPKSGSTYAANVLLRYYGIENPPLPEGFLNDYVPLDRLTGAPFVLQIHCLPTAANLQVIRAHEIAPVVLWRNLADAVISFDDHIRNEGVEGAAGLFTYVGNRARYLSLPDQRRYQFLIDNMLPWYVAFYVSWRDAGAPLVMRYGELAADPLAYFTRIVERISGSADRARLEAILGGRIPNSRLNVGRNGRSGELMSDETKALLEAALRRHYDDLTPLIEELPWRQPVWDRATPATSAWTLPG